MESYNDLETQINGLVFGIRQCNFIPYIEKMEIKQDAWCKIIEKMNEGVLEDNYDKIKGYTFLIVRNLCNTYHNKKGRILYTDELREDSEEQPTMDIINNNKLHQILLNYVENKKFNDKQKELLKLLLNNDTEDEIKKKLNLKVGEMGKLKFGLIMKLKTASSRPTKYLIKNRKDNNILIPCGTQLEVYYRLNEKYNKKLVQDSIRNNKDIGDFYIEKIKPLK
jgi:DNA-directed RNA polymerase specialized sigma24 family protein